MRIKRGLTKRRKHKQILKAAKGYRMSYSKLYRRAREALMHAGQYSFAHRRKRANDFRRLWIQKINGALSTYNFSYSKFIAGLKTHKIELNRKMLADIAEHNPEVFASVVEKVRGKE